MEKLTGWTTNLFNRTKNRNPYAKADPRGSVKLGVHRGLVKMRAGEQDRVQCPVSIKELQRLYHGEPNGVGSD